MMGYRGIIVSTLLWAGSGAVLAEPLPIDLDDLRAGMHENANGLANLYQELSIIGTTPGISAANFRIGNGSSDPLDIDSWKFTPSHAFDIGIDGFRPYIEGTFSYLKSDQRLDLGYDGSVHNRLDLETYTLSALGGFGAEFDIASGTILRPMALFGYSYSDNDASASGPLGSAFRRAGHGFLSDFKIRSLLYGGALELEQRHRWQSDVQLLASLRYDYLIDDSYRASDSALEGRNEFSVFTGSTELNGPTELSLFGLPLRWIGFISGSYLPDIKDNIGFDYFVEIGGGIELVDNDVIPGIDGVSLRGSGIVGDGVDGWSVGLNAEF